MTKRPAEDFSDRLSKHLAKGTSEDVLRSYLAQVKNGVWSILLFISMTAML